MLTYMKNHGTTLEEQANLLKPSAKRSYHAIAQFRPNPTMSKYSGVFLYIALTKLEKTNGMFLFLQRSEGDSNSEWKEHEVVVEPGEAVMWRGDCMRKAGEGHGGIALVIGYD